MQNERVIADRPSEEVMNMIAKARRLTKEYYLTDYEDQEKQCDRCRKRCNQIDSCKLCGGWKSMPSDQISGLKKKAYSGR